MEKNELYADKKGYIWKVERMYPKPCVLVEAIGKNCEVIDTIENFEKRGLKKLN